MRSLRYFYGFKALSHRNDYNILTFETEIRKAIMSKVKKVTTLSIKVFPTFFVFDACEQVPNYQLRAMGKEFARLNRFARSINKTYGNSDQRFVRLEDNRLKEARRIFRKSMKRVKKSS